MPKYSFAAIVNYPESKEIYTPVYANIAYWDVGVLLNKLLKNEKDATSFVITLTVHP